MSLLLTPLSEPSELDYPWLFRYEKMAEATDGSCHQSLATVLVSTTENNQTPIACNMQTFSNQFNFIFALQESTLHLNLKACSYAFNPIFGLLVSDSFDHTHFFITGWLCPFMEALLVTRYPVYSGVVGGLYYRLYARP